MSARIGGKAKAGFGVILLCHAPLARACEVARHWAVHGVPVAVHIDAQTPAPEAAAMAAALADLPGVTFVARQRSDWGSWGLVSATLAAAQALLERYQGLGHILLTSGACLPIRPVAELSAHLAAHPDTDFIEAVALGSRRWTKGGLEAERFSLYFPVSWRRRRWLFDLLVRMQRRLRIRRRLPPGLTPHLGLQWWCLTTTTLRAILGAPDLPQLQRYFRGVWIPDESFFQSLAARHARQLALPLTFQRFDLRGNPHVLYDDHREVLAASPAFIARKVWPGAEGLYRAFLDAPEATRAATTQAPDALERRIEAAHALRRDGRVGLRSMGRLPDPRLGLPPTAARYGLLWGAGALIPGLDGWWREVARALHGDAHGRLFAPDRAWFAGTEALAGQPAGPGALSSAAALRDYAPVDFLSNLIWATRGRPQFFLADAEDGARVAAAVAEDPHACGLVVTGTAPLPEAAAAEAEGLRLLTAAGARHRLRIVPATAFVNDPAAHLAAALAPLWPEGRPMSLPALPPVPAGLPGAEGSAGAWP